MIAVLFLLSAGIIDWYCLTSDRIACVSAEGMVDWVGFSSDGSTVAANSKAFNRWSIQVWRLGREGTLSPTRLDFIKADHSSSPSVAIQGNRLGYTDIQTGKFVIWNVVDDREIKSFSFPLTMEKIAFSPNGSYLSAIWHWVRIFSVKEERAIVELMNSEGSDFTCAAFSRDERFAYIGDSKGNITTVDLQSTSTTKKPVTRKEITCLDVSPQNDQIAVGDRSGFVTICSSDASPKILMNSEEGFINDIRYSPQGKYLAIATREALHPWPGGRSGKVIVYIASTLEIKKQFRWFFGKTQAIAFGPDEEKIAVGEWFGTGGRVSIWSIGD